VACNLPFSQGDGASIAQLNGRRQMPTTRRKGARRSARKYGKAAGKSVEAAVRRMEEGKLLSGKAGHGGRVTSRKQAIAIGLSEARKRGAKVPPPPR